MKFTILLFLAVLQASAQTNRQEKPLPPQARNFLYQMTNKWVEVIETKNKVVDHIGDRAQVAYVVTIANRNPHFVLNNVQINFLDKEGFILAKDFAYRFETQAKTTNTVRGTVLMSGTNASQIYKVEALLEPQKPAFSR